MLEDCDREQAIGPVELSIYKISVMLLHFLLSRHLDDAGFMQGSKSWSVMRTVEPLTKSIPVSSAKAVCKRVQTSISFPPRPDVALGIQCKAHGWLNSPSFNISHAGQQVPARYMVA
jgi:hypothetical protein